MAQTITFRGSASAGNDAAGTSLATSSAVASVAVGDIVLVWAKHENTPGTISVSNGTNTLTGLTKRDHTNADLSGQWFWERSPVSGSITYTMTTASKEFRSIIAFVFSTTGIGVFDVEALSAVGATGTSMASGTFTTTGTVEVAVAGYANFGGGTPSSQQINGVAADGTVTDASTNASAWYRILSATVTGATATGTIASADYILNVATIKAVVPTLSGTAFATITETDIVASGKTIIATLAETTITPNTAVTPVIEAADCTVSGSNTAQDPWAVSHPNASTGDLLIFYIAWDDSTATTDVAEPAGPNSEVLTEINATPVTDSSTETRAKAWYTVATGAWTAGTVSFNPTATESWSATCMRVPAGEFDASTPIGAIGTSADTTGTDTTVDSPAFSAGATDGDGRLVWGAGVDVDPLSGTNPTGWTIRQAQDLGAVAHGIATRDAAVTDSESIASATWSIAGDSWTSIAFVVRAPTTTLFSAARQAFIDGFNSAQSEGTGWNAEVRDKAAVTEVVRTDDNTITWTLAAQASYNITAQETITGTLAAAMVASAPAGVVMTPTFTIDTSGGAGAALDGSASLAITTASLLSTSITCVGAATLTLATSSALTTAIRVTGAASLAVTSTSALTTAIRFTGAGSITVTGASALTTAIRFVAPSATVTLTGTSGLTTAISLSSTATVAITASGGMQETGAALAGASTVTMTGASVLTTAILVAGAGSVSLSTLADLTTAIRFTGAAALTVTTTAQMEAVGAALAGVATVTFTGASDVTTQVVLTGPALVSFTASSAFTTAIRLAGTASVTVTVSPVGFLVAHPPVGDPPLHVVSLIAGRPTIQSVSRGVVELIGASA